MSTRYRTTLTGAFPRPEALVQATRDLDRGRISPEQGEAAFREAEGKVAQLEQELGVASRTGGYLRWQDLFRPFSGLWEGVRLGTLTRFFETNTFYRQPVLDAPPEPEGNGLSAWLPQGPEARAILPGPYTFAGLSEIAYRPKGPGGAVGDVAAALASELRSLGPKRPPQIQFAEPRLVREPPSAADRSVEEAYRAIAEAAGDSQLSVWTYFGDAGPALGQLAALPVRTVGFDLFETELPTNVDLRGKGLGAGCIESRSTLPEDEHQVTALVKAAEKALRPTEVWLGPNPPLDLLPFEAASSKLRLLPRLREVLER